MPVRIVTDATASLPTDLCRQLGITVVPVPIHFGDYTHMDGIDSTEQFYDQLERAERPPTSATPSPGAFAECYGSLLDGETEVVAIHLMESKSAVINVARMGAQMVSAERVHVVDSGSLSLGMGLLAVAAARAAQMGQTAREIVAMLEQIKENVCLYAAIPQLTQLRRSGRVSLSSAMLAGLLAIKPILCVSRSTIEVVDKVRGWPSAVSRVVELAEQRVSGARVHLAVVHTNARAEAEELLGAIRHRFDCIDAMVAEAGPALATHAGPGVLGLVTLEER